MRQRLRRSATVWVLFLVALLLTPEKRAEAGSYKFSDALVTVGVASATGAVLGLSTLPFYAYPEDHMQNVLIGAGAGILVGMGVAVFLSSTSSDEDTNQDVAPEELLLPKKKKPSPEEPAKKEKEAKPEALRLSTRRYRIAENSIPVRSGQAPLYRGGWTVALNVLELRF